jgi:hypothetical protein
MDRRVVLAEKCSSTRLSLRSVKELGWVDGGHEIEPVRRCWRTRAGVVGPMEQGFHVFDWSATETDVYHGAYEHPNHVMQKPIRLDPEAEATAFGPYLPLRE